MTPEQFVLWMQGFIEGSNAYNLTPAGWDTVKAKLKEVTPVAKKTFKPLPQPSCPWAGRDDKTPLVQEGPPWPQIYPTTPPYRYTSPSLPDEMFKVTCGSGEEPSTWKYYNNSIEVPAPGVTWEDKVSNESTVPTLDLKLEAAQIQHKLKEICKDVTLEQEEESGLPYWQYRENLGVQKGPFIPQYYTTVKK